MNPNELAPYRVEWRPNLVTGWMLMKGYDTHDEALTAAGEKRREYGGQTRVVTQHVIHAEGLGAEAF